MRNWGFRKIKKIFRSPDWRVRYPNLILMANEGKKQWILNSVTGVNTVLFEECGLTWVAKCPLIMGAYYAYLVEGMRQDICFDVNVVIDLCSPGDKDKVSKGAEAAFRVMLDDAEGVVLQPVVCDPYCHSMIPITFTEKDI
jgi:hypothetical protein